MRLLSLFTWFFLALIAPLTGATKLIALGCVRARELPLNPDRGVERVAGAGELGEHAVPGALDDVAAVGEHQRV